MTGTSAAGIIVIMAVVLAGALAMILWIFVAGSHGSFRHRRVDHRAGDVRGGIHVGDPGSVMPRRDAPANPADPDATGPDRPLEIGILDSLWRGTGRNQAGRRAAAVPGRQAALLRAHVGLHRLVRRLLGGRGPLFSPRGDHSLGRGAGHPAVRRDHRQRGQRDRPPPPVTVSGWRPRPGRGGAAAPWWRSTGEPLLSERRLGDLNPGWARTQTALAVRRHRPD